MTTLPGSGRCTQDVEGRQTRAHGGPASYWHSGQASALMLLSASIKINEIVATNNIPAKADVLKRILPYILLLPRRLKNRVWTQLSGCLLSRKQHAVRANFAT